MIKIMNVNFCIFKFHFLIEAMPEVSVCPPVAKARAGSKSKADHQFFIPAKSTLCGERGCLLMMEYSTFRSVALALVWSSVAKESSRRT